MSQVPQVPLSALAGLYSRSNEVTEPSRLSINKSPVITISRVHSESSTPPTSPPPHMPIQRAILDTFFMDPRHDKEQTSPNAQISSSTVLRHQAVIGLARYSDLRAVCLKEEYAEIFPEILQNVRPIDEIKTPYDFWSFVEPVFLPLRPQLFSGVWNESVIHEARLLAAQPEYPHYSWMWAMEDCFDWSLISSRTNAKRIVEAVARPLTRFPSKPILGSELALKRPATSPKPKGSTVIDMHNIARAELMDARNANQSLLEALHRMVIVTAKAEQDDCDTRRATLAALVSFASLTYRRLYHEQILDSIEEVFPISDAEVVVVYDDGLKIKASVASPAEVGDILNERNRLFASLRDSTFPFSTSETRQQGPFCHICRERKPEFAKCAGRLGDFFDPSAGEDEGSRKCPRRFCTECLRLYNWPLPPASGVWNCPVCLKLCTCERCVRNVYLHSCSSFAMGCGAGVASEPLPGRQLGLDTLRLLAPDSFFLSTKVATPHKKPRPPPTVDATKESIDDLLTPQAGRVKEAERIGRLLKALQRCKQSEMRRLAVLKANLKREEVILLKLQQGISKIGTDDRYDIDDFLAKYLPNLEDLCKNDDDDGTLTAEFKRKFEKLSKNKIGKIFPADSETDEDESESRKLKLRRIANIEGSLKHLEGVNLAPGTTLQQTQAPRQVGFSAGLIGLSHYQLRKLRSN